MTATPEFPNDENGQVLRRMFDGGDALTQARVVDFCFVFPDREAALAFLRDVEDRTLETCLSWYQEKSMWEVIVKRHMIPQHATIRAMESMLTQKAENLGGKPDGWGCMQTKMR